jgi:SAM-dependent methyltransferase
MTQEDWLICPVCSRAFHGLRRCDAGHRYTFDDGFRDFLANEVREPAATEVSRFYDDAPFPGYAPGETAESLLARSRRSPFLAALDRAIPPQARVLDAGCGTGLVAAFLALAAKRRTVVAVDACVASLREAARFRRIAGIDGLELVRADLFALPLAPGAFDVVISRGVVHHTARPFDAIAAVATRVREGGLLALGFYETQARLAHRLRRAIFGRSRRDGSIPRSLRRFDPVLRAAALSPEQERIWVADQYRHPLESLLPAPAVIAALRGLGFAALRTIPPLDDRSFAPAAADDSGWRLAARRLGWIARGIRDPDCGLVFVVGNRSADPRPDVTVAAAH